MNNKQKPLNSSYISCMKLNGSRLLPPIMTDEKRAEMNKWKMEAMKSEQDRSKRQSRLTNTSCSTTGDYVDCCSTPKTINDSSVTINSDNVNDPQLSVKESPRLIRRHTYKVENPLVVIPPYNDYIDQAKPDSFPQVPQCRKLRRKWECRPTSKWNEIRRELRAQTDISETSSTSTLFNVDSFDENNKNVDSHSNKTCIMSTEPENFKDKVVRPNSSPISATSGTTPSGVVDDLSSDMFVSDKSSRINSATVNCSETFETNEFYMVFRNVYNEQLKQKNSLLERHCREQTELIKYYEQQMNNLYQNFCKLKMNSSTSTNQSLEQNLTESETIVMEINGNPKEEFKNTEKLLENNIVLDKISNTELNLTKTSDINENLIPLTTRSEDIQFFVTTNKKNHDIARSQSVSSIFLNKQEINSARDSFPCETQASKLSSETAKEIWAATKICAVVRGYLTRRLMRTERVQSCIKTLQDSIKLAVQMHQENADNIKPSDVELHRRLIQQVTGTCNEFNNIMTNTNRIEQLNIIAADRQHLKNRSTRLSTGRSPTLSATTKKVIERKAQAQRLTPQSSCTL